MPCSRDFNAANKSFNATRENKILAKFPDVQYILSMHV